MFNLNTLHTSWMTCSDGIFCTVSETYTGPTGQPQPSLSFFFFLITANQPKHPKKRKKKTTKKGSPPFLWIVLTVGSRVCSKVSFLWSNSWWWEAVDTRCTANTLHAMRNRWLSSRSGRRWDAGILHTRMDDDIQSLGNKKRHKRGRRVAFTGPRQNDTGAWITGCSCLMKCSA